MGEGHARERVRGKCMCQSREGRKAMASLGSCKKLIASGSQICAGIFEIDGEGVDREKLQEMTEGRE